MKEIETQKLACNASLNRLLEALNASSSLALSISERKKQTKNLIAVISDEKSTASNIANAGIGFGKVPAAYITEKGHLGLINKHINQSRKDINKLLTLMMKSRV